MDSHDTVPAGMKSPSVSLPRGSYLPINRCNLPAHILGGLTFQHAPAPLQLDGVACLHRDLWQRLQPLTDPAARVAQFCDYLAVHFRLDHPEQQGYEPGGRGRIKATWQRMLRGWSFDADGREGAVLKGWVESRFGLLPRFHRQPLRDFSAPAYRRYLEARAEGLYNTNALEAQLDLIYSFCQLQLAQNAQPVATPSAPAASAEHRLFADGPAEAASHLSLYRGINRLEQMEQLGAGGAEAMPVLLLNNLNSFSRDPERASEFGDRVAMIRVPREKVFCYDQLFPGQLQGEGEYIVIGGLYRVSAWVF